MLTWPLIMLSGHTKYCMLTDDMGGTWVEVRRRLLPEELTEWMVVAKLGGFDAGMRWVIDFNRKEDRP